VVSAVIGVELVLNFIIASAVSGHPATTTLYERIIRSVMVITKRRNASQVLGGRPEEGAGIATALPSLANAYDQRGGNVPEWVKYFLNSK